MKVLLARLANEPALVVAVIVGLLMAAQVALAVALAGGSALIAVNAALGSLLVSLGGGAIVRSNVEPAGLAEDRRVLAVAEATLDEHRDLTPSVEDAGAPTVSE